jgi:hypothetical protein
MYTLRQIKQDGREINFYLGENYTIYTKEKTPKDIKRLIDLWYGNVNSSDEVTLRQIDMTFAFIDSSNINIEIPLLSEDENYIVGFLGKTFQKISI